MRISTSLMSQQEKRNFIGVPSFTIRTFLQSSYSAGESKVQRNLPQVSAVIKILIKSRDLQHRDRTWVTATMTSQAKKLQNKTAPDVLMRQCGKQCRNGCETKHTNRLSIESNLMKDTGAPGRSVKEQLTSFLAALVTAFNFLSCFG